MADYIYLLQHRLTPNQRRALEAVRDAARSKGAPVFLVGGAVRDLTSGSPVRDLDFAVQGDVEALGEAFKASGAAMDGENLSLLSRYFLFPGGVRVEVGATISVNYPRPAEPLAQPAPILDDLRRRDFTVNAMAVSLNEGSYGLLLDPLNGIADLENRELRLVSNLGFIDQPGLLIRAARLSHRLGFSLEERTQRRYENAKEEDSVERLSEQARAYEVEEIFHEEDPVSILDHLRSEGWLPALSPVLGGLRPDTEGLDRVRDTLGQMEQLGIYADPSAVYFPILTNKLTPADATALKSSFTQRGFAARVDSLEARSREVSSQLLSKAMGVPSAAWKFLFGTEPELVLYLASGARSGALHARFKAFFNEWPQARQRIPYGLMQEMRITPDLPGYEAVVEDLFFALMDGKLGTPEELRAFLEPISPPAPAQQAAPRRRPAKSARGRGRPAATALPVDEPDEDAGPEDDSNADDRDEDEQPSEDDLQEVESDLPEEDEEDEPELDEAPHPSPAAKVKSDSPEETPLKGRLSREPKERKAAPKRSVVVVVPASAAKAEAADKTTTRKQVGKKANTKAVDEQSNSAEKAPAKAVDADTASSKAASTKGGGARSRVAPGETALQDTSHGKAGAKVVAVKKDGTPSGRTVSAPPAKASQAAGARSGKAASGKGSERG